MEYVKKCKVVFILYSISFSDIVIIIYFYDFKEFCWIMILFGSFMELMYCVFIDWFYLIWEGYCLINNKFYNFFGIFIFYKYFKGVFFINLIIICW